MKLSDITDTARIIAAKTAELDALRQAVTADTPTLDAFTQAVNGWGVLRNRDRLAVTVTGSAWDFGRNSNGAYLDAVFYVGVTRDGSETRGHLQVRTVAYVEGRTVAAMEWETIDGRTLRYQCSVGYAVLPDAARKIIEGKIHDTWGAMATPVAVLWNEALSFEAAQAVRTNTLHAVENLARLVVGVES